MMAVQDGAEPDHVPVAALQVRVALDEREKPGLQNGVAVTPFAWLLL